MYALEYIPFDASALRFAGRITPNISHETRGETEEGGTSRKPPLLSRYD